MKKKYIFIASLFLMITFVSNAQLDENKNLLNQFKKGFLAKEQEDSLSNIATQYLSNTQNQKTYDSLNQKIIELYSKGKVAALKELLRINEENQTGKLTIKEIEKFKEKYRDVKYNDPNTMLGYYYSNAISNNFSNFIDKDSIASVSLIATLNSNTLNNIAWNLKEKNKHLIFAARISKLSIDKIHSELADSSHIKKDVNKQWLLSHNNALAMFENTYAIILLKLGKKKDALNNIKVAINNIAQANSNINLLYITLLNDNDMYNECIREGSKIYVKGKEDDDFLKQIHIAYNKNHTEREWNIYLDTLEMQKEKMLREYLVKSLINKPVNNFTLKDLNGDSVSLSEYKGKVVVLDFWATWCGPCKKSFPGMQMAIDKYKNNSDVVFLFIDTWENNATPSETKEAVSNFIKENKYNFHVLLDQKKDEKSDFEVGDTFKKEFEMEGIPTKFFIGKDGNVKFMSVGYSGSDQKVLEEVSRSINYLLENV